MKKQMKFEWYFLSLFTKYDKTIEKDALYVLTTDVEALFIKKKIMFINKFFKIKFIINSHSKVLYLYILAL